VVQFLGFCLSPPCVAAEFCSRGSVFDVLRGAAADPDAAAELTWRRTLDMAIGGATGMLHLHTRSPQVVHRDLKSPNLLVTGEWTVKVRAHAPQFLRQFLCGRKCVPRCDGACFAAQVADFNLSRLVEEATHGSEATAGGASNPRWLAPEILEGKRASPASDVYAFGVVLWELLTWKLPFEGVATWTIVNAVLSGVHLEVPAPEALPALALAGGRPGLQGYLQLMDRCWVREADQRPGFQEIVQALRALG
jgi:serine/threonine protein kinase